MEVVGKKAPSVLAFVFKCCFACFIITSCNESKQSVKNIQAKKLKLEVYIDSVLNKFTGYDSNGVIKEELNSYLKEDIKKEINNGLFSDLPLKLNAVEKCGKEYTLNLDHRFIHKDLSEKGMLSDINFELFALTDEKTAKSLHEGRLYIIEVKFEEYITFQNNKKYCAYSLYDRFKGYINYLSESEFEFGAIGVKLNKIVPAPSSLN